VTPPQDTSSRAGITLEAFLRGCRLAELEAFYMFWMGSDPVPDAHADLVERLLRRMQSVETVRSRMKILTRSQRDVLLAVVAAEGLRVRKTAFLQGTVSDALEPYEVEVAAQTLLKRGFLAEIPAGIQKGGEAAYAVPRELGDILGRLYRATDRSPRTLFSLTGYVEGMKTDALTALHGHTLSQAEVGNREILVVALTEADRIRARLQAVSNRRIRTLMRTVVTQFGGILTRSLFDRINTGGLAWDVDAFRAELESHLLGTACFLNFEAFGIGLMEEGIVVFREVVEALLEENRPDAAGFSRRVDLGADILSDMQRILMFLGRETVRFTRDRTLYKTVRKRLREEMILREVGRLHRDGVLDFLFDYLREKDFLTARIGKAARPTRDGLAHGRLPLDRQMQQLLKHVLSTFPSQAESFHHRSLLALFLDRFRTLEPGCWYDPMDLPFRARNAYLTELETLSVQEVFQNRYEYASHLPREDPFQMAWRLFDLLTGPFVMLGLVEVGLEGDRIVAVRVTPLGRRLLGPETARAFKKKKRTAGPRSAPAPRPCLIVNPDFEVLLHPGPDTLEITYFLDRFSERLHADHHLHFRIDRVRFQDQVGRGADVDQFLTILEEKARTPIPQNIAVTLRDWASEVKTVTANQVLLLECEDPAVLDRVASMASVKPAVHRRLGPDLLALKAERVDPALVEELRAMGVFLR